MLSRALLLLSLAGSLWASPVFALDVPKLTGPVVDLAGVLSRSDQAKIAASLLQFQRSYGPQLQVLVVPKLEDETIESYSIKVVDEWKLGSEDKDDGVLLLVVTEDRKVRIEVGQGLEGDLPDALAGRIIRAGIIPFFKQDQTGAGILIGLSMIAESVGGKLENIPTPQMHRVKRGGGNEPGLPAFSGPLFDRSHALWTRAKGRCWYRTFRWAAFGQPHGWRTWWFWRRWLRRWWWRLLRRWRQWELVDGAFDTVRS